MFFKKNFCYLILLNIFFVSICYSKKDNRFVDIMANLGATSENSAFYLSKLGFESDVYLSKTEFFYLTDLAEGKLFTPKDLYKAYKNLLEKKSFINIDIEISQDINKKNGKIIFFKITSGWIFRKLDLRNIWFDKNKYINLYLQQPGDIFDISLHEESIKAIKTYLYDNGYFNCNVNDEIIYRKRGKTVIVRLYIKNKKCFIVNKLNFNLASSVSNQEISDQDIKNFQKSLSKKIGVRLAAKDYSKNLIKKQVEHIKDFFKKRGFLSCNVLVKRLIDKSTCKVTLFFEIKLGKRKILHFIGNKFFTEKQIRQDFLDEDFPEWLLEPEIVAQHLLYEYHKRGFWNTVIVYKKKDGALFFTIKEGEPIIINDVQIKDIRTDTFLDKQDFFNELISKKELNEKLLQDSIEKLKKYYLSNGYWDFVVCDKSFKKTGEKNLYKIVLSVKRFEQRFLDGLKIEDFEYLEREDFFKKYFQEIKNGYNPFSYYSLQEQKNFLVRYFQNKSYWYVDVYPEIKTSFIQDKKDSVKIFLTWKINLGPQITFGKVFLRGDTKVPFKRVMKNLRLKQGDLWDRQKLDQARRSLKKLDMFKTVQLQPYKLSKSKKKQDQPLVLTLIDDDPVQARLRLGYFLTSKNFLFKRESTYRLGGSFIVKNLTKNADKLLFNADFTRFERKIDFDYQYPDPFGLSNNDLFFMGKIKAYNSKYTHPVQIGQSGSAFEAIQNGFFFGINSEYRKDHFFGAKLGNEWVRTTRVRGNLNFSPEMVNKTLPYFFIEPTIVIDKLDDKLNVKKGTLSFFSFRFMIPENTGEVTGKLMLEQSFFCSFIDRFILCARIRFGHIFRQNFQEVQPIERFFLGGPYSVRGYEMDSIPPLGVMEIINPDGTEQTLYTIQGGSSMINCNFEARFPIYKSFGGVVFQDFGVLSQTGFSGFTGKWYPATGFGFRYQTPVGAIRFDIGWKWKRRLVGDSSYAWYLTLGQAF